MGAQQHPADADADAMQDHTWKTSLKNVLFYHGLHVNLYHSIPAIDFRFL